MDNVEKAMLMLTVVTIVGGVLMLTAHKWAHSEDWPHTVAKSVLVFLICVIASVFLFGCSVQYPQVANPRALQWGIGQPHCLFLCFATATATDAEAGSNQTSAVNTNQSADISPEIGVAPQ